METFDDRLSWLGPTVAETASRARGARGGKGSTWKAALIAAGAPSQDPDSQAQGRSSLAASGSSAVSALSYLRSSFSGSSTTAAPSVSSLSTAISSSSSSDPSSGDGFLPSRTTEQHRYPVEGIDNPPSSSPLLQPQQGSQQENQQEQKQEQQTERQGSPMGVSPTYDGSLAPASTAGLGNLVGGIETSLVSRFQDDWSLKGGGNEATRPRKYQRHHLSHRSPHDYRGYGHSVPGDEHAPGPGEGIKREFDARGTGSIDGVREAEWREQGHPPWEEFTKSDHADAFPCPSPSFSPVVDPAMDRLTRGTGVTGAVSMNNKGALLPSVSGSSKGVSSDTQRGLGKSGDEDKDVPKGVEMRVVRSAISVSTAPDTVPTASTLAVSVTSASSPATSVPRSPQMEPDGAVARNREKELLNRGSGFVQGNGATQDAVQDADAGDTTPASPTSSSVAVENTVRAGDEVGLPVVTVGVSVEARSGYRRRKRLVLTDGAYSSTKSTKRRSTSGATGDDSTASRSRRRDGKAAMASLAPPPSEVTPLRARERTVEAINTEERMLESGRRPARQIACTSNHFTYYGPVRDGSEVRIGVIKYRYFCGASDGRGATETRRVMALGVKVFFGKVPRASPFVCAGILRKENYKNYVLVFDTRDGNFLVLQLNSFVRFCPEHGLNSESMNEDDAESRERRKNMSRMISILNEILEGGSDNKIRIKHLRDGTLKKAIAEENTLAESLIREGASISQGCVMNRNGATLPSSTPLPSTMTTSSFPSFMDAPPLPTGFRSGSHPQPPQGVTASETSALPKTGLAPELKEAPLPRYFFPEEKVSSPGNFNGAFPTLPPGGPLSRWSEVPADPDFTPRAGTDGALPVRQEADTGGRSREEGDACISLDSQQSPRTLLATTPGSRGFRFILMPPLPEPSVGIDGSRMLSSRELVVEGEMDNADETLGQGSSGTDDGTFASRSCSRSRAVDASPSDSRGSHSSHTRAEGEENGERVGVVPEEPTIPSSFRDQKAGGSGYPNHVNRIQVLQQRARSLVSLGFPDLDLGDVGVAESEGVRSAEDTPYVSTSIVAATDVDGCRENGSFRNHEIHRTREGQAAAVAGQIGLSSPSRWRMGTVTNGLDIGLQATRKLKIDGDLGSSVVQSFLGSPPAFPNVRGGGPSVQTDGTAAQSPSPNRTTIQIDSDGLEGIANKQSKDGPTQQMMSTLGDHSSPLEPELRSSLHPQTRGSHLQYPQHHQQQRHLHQVQQEDPWNRQRGQHHQYWQQQQHQQQRHHQHHRQQVASSRHELHRVGDLGGMVLQQQPGGVSVPCSNEPSPSFPPRRVEDFSVGGIPSAGGGSGRLVACTASLEGSTNASSMQNSSLGSRADMGNVACREGTGAEDVFGIFPGDDQSPGWL